MSLPDQAAATPDESRSPAPLDEPIGFPNRLDYGEQDVNGVDLSLLRWVLKMKPIDRLRYMEKCARDTKLLNEYGKRLKPAQPHAQPPLPRSGSTS